MSDIIDRLLRLPEVEQAVGLRSTSIYDRIAAGTFPKQIPVGPKDVRWLQSEVQAWIYGRRDERDKAA